MTTIKHDTFTLAAPKGRMPGTPGHESARRYLELRFAQIGLRPYEGNRDWSFTYRTRVGGRDLAMTNLVGVVPGADPRLDPIVIGAHYDSVIEAPCADDNASSVAVVLNLAQRLMDAPLQRDVVICAFDGEEPPFFHSPAMGSTRFVEDHLRACHLAVIMDLIGHPLAVPDVDPRHTVVTGAESHPALNGILDGVSLPVIATRNDLVGDMSDHYAFRLAGHPFLFLSSGEWEDYHTPEDLPQYLDYAKLDAVADAIEVMVRHADHLELGPAQRHDTTHLEWATLREHLPAAMLDRDLDRIVPSMRASMGGWLPEAPDPRWHFPFNRKRRRRQA